MDRRMTVGRFVAEVDALQDKLDEIAVFYQQAARDLVDRRDFETHDAGRISGIGHGDSTGAIVVQHEGTRKKLADASAKIKGWSKGADGILNSLMSLYDPKEHDSLRSYTTPDPAALETQNRARRERERRVIQGKRQRLETRLRKLLKEAG